MTMESETQEQTAAADQAAEEAAFGAGFTGEPIATPAPTAAPVATEGEVKATPDVTEPEKKETEAAPPAPSPEPTSAPAYDAQAAIRKLQGQIGDLNSLLREQMKAKADAGKPATATPLELKRMKDQFPELAEYLQEDLAETLAAFAPKGSDPKEVQDLIEKGVARGIGAEMAQLRDAAVTDRHENWKTDLYADLKTGAKTPEYQAWLKTMSEADGQAFENSTNPYFVIKRLDSFYEFKNKAARAKTQKDERLAAAVTPQGVPRAGQQSLSDEEALRKGFEAGFST